MNFGQCMDVGDAWVDLEGQCRRSKVKVTRQKKRNSRSHLWSFKTCCHGQGSHGVRLMGNWIKQWCPSLFQRQVGSLQHQVAFFLNQFVIFPF